MIEVNHGVAVSLGGGSVVDRHGLQPLPSSEGLGLPVEVDRWFQPCRLSEIKI